MLCFLIARPPVILLDEPLTSFDVVVALEIKQLLREIKHDHILVFSTHILQLATDPVSYTHLDVYKRQALLFF